MAVFFVPFFRVRLYYIAYFMRLQYVFAYFVRFVDMHKLEVFFVAILDKSEIINRIKDLSKEQGTSLTFMYKQLGLPSGYLRDVNANKTALTETRIEAIANFLNTTPEYLKGETDIKEKTAPITEDGLSEKECELLRIFRLLSVEEQDLFLKMFHARQE